MKNPITDYPRTRQWIYLAGALAAFVGFSGTLPADATRIVLLVAGCLGLLAAANVNIPGAPTDE